MAQQLSFDLPIRQALGRADFLVAPSNALAVHLIDQSPDWPTPQLVLSGPAGAGKSHLAQVWAMGAGAAIVRATDLTANDIPPLASRPVAVEDVPEIRDIPAAEKALFHLFNQMRANGQPLLLTGQGAPVHWGLSLADLQSRVSSACHAALDLPDDTLLAAILGKLFADRQIMPKPDVIPYLVRHIERSFREAQNVVARLDKASLDTGRTLTRALAADVLGEKARKPG